MWVRTDYHRGMTTPIDVARIRRDNALLLFDEFVRAVAAHPDSATLRGLERRFAERLQIQPSYWSQIKSQSRQIGERLARQFELLCHKPHGWMDRPGSADAPSAGAGTTTTGPSDDDEKFIVGLVLTFYRRHPQRARARLLDLLGEVLAPVDREVPTTVKPNKTSSSQTSTPGSTKDAEADLWAKARANIAPLKRR